MFCFASALSLTESEKIVYILQILPFKFKCLVTTSCRILTSIPPSFIKSLGLYSKSLKRIFQLTGVVWISSILDVATSSGILKAKQKLGETFNSDKLGSIDFTKFSKLTMCSAQEEAQVIVPASIGQHRHCTCSVLKIL